MRGRLQGNDARVMFRWWFGVEGRRRHATLARWKEASSSQHAPRDPLSRTARFGPVRDSESGVYLVELGVVSDEAFGLLSCRRARAPLIPQPPSFTTPSLLFPFCVVIF